jgi:gas vesicle protein
MTIRQKMIQTLHLRGMWEDDAAQLVSEVEQRLKSMMGRWEEDCEGYPTVLLAAVWMDVRTLAQQWIEEKRPQVSFLQLED